MNNKDIIFNEVFSTYYRVLREILNSQSMNNHELQNLIKAHGSDESDLFLLDNLENTEFIAAGASTSHSSCVISCGNVTKISITRVIQETPSGNP